METLTEELVVDHEVLLCGSNDELPHNRVLRDGSAFSFELHRKAVEMGDVTFDHYWMDIRGLYGDGRRSANREAIIGYFWALCHKHLTVTHEDVQESYLLVNLLPHARKKGSRRVFYDSGQWHSTKAELDKTTLTNWLDDLLQGSKSKQLTEIQFRDRTGDLLGPMMYLDDVWEVYHQFTDDVLLAGRRALEARGEKAGLRAAFDAWDKKMRRFGRHRGHDNEKLVLDVLSYEARAAFHRCYSAVWYDLIPHLANNYELSDESAIFHKLWHLDIQREAHETDEANFHLFHGSILGLHPASRIFMLTQTGTALIGDWLADPHCIEKYQRLLHGLFMSIYQYDERQENYAQLRKKGQTGISVPDWTAREEEQVDSRSGRRRSGRRETDAR